MEFHDVGIIRSVDLHSDWELDLTIRFIHVDKYPINIKEHLVELEKMMRKCALWDIHIKPDNQREASDAKGRGVSSCKNFKDNSMVVI